jgi:hypothetical protein
MFIIENSILKHKKDNMKINPDATSEKQLYSHICYKTGSMIENQSDHEARCGVFWAGDLEGPSVA